MKKRIEKVVECIEYTGGLTIGKRYTTYSESERFYSVMDDEGDAEAYNKKYFKVVSEKEILEFEGFNLDVFGKNQYSLWVISDIELWNYDLKLIATPKDSPYEGKSREELIEIIKELKTNKR